MLQVLLVGNKANHGEIKGNISNGTDIGTITKNTPFGVYGMAEDISKLNINMRRGNRDWKKRRH